MAITRIRASTKARSASNSAATSFGTLPIAGHAVAVFAWGDGVANTTGNSCTDNQGVGNTYTLVASAVSSAAGLIACAIWVCPAIGATSGTFTVTAKVATGLTGTITAAVEFSALTLPVDVTAATNSGASTTTLLSGTTGTTAQTDEVALAVEVLTGGNSNTTSTTPTNYTQDVQEVDNNTWQAGQGDDQILSATGTQSASWTVAPAGTYAACIAVVKGAVVANTFIAPPPYVVRQAVNRAANW